MPNASGLSAWPDPAVRHRAVLHVKASFSCLAYSPGVIKFRQWGLTCIQWRITVRYQPSKPRLFAMWRRRSRYSNRQPQQPTPILVSSLLIPEGSDMGRQMNSRFGLGSKHQGPLAVASRRDSSITRHFISRCRAAPHTQIRCHTYHDNLPKTPRHFLDINHIAWFPVDSGDMSANMMTAGQVKLDAIKGLHAPNDPRWSVQPILKCSITSGRGELGRVCGHPARAAKMVSGVTFCFRKKTAALWRSKRQ